MPQTYEIRWSYKSLQDLQRLRDFLQPKNPAAAAKAIAEIKSLVKKLKTNPLIGVLLGQNDPRREIFPRFGRYGYTVRYTVDEDSKIVYVLRVWHGKEKRQ